MAHTLVLLRHGQSEWNVQNLFTGWHDVDLTELGEAEARGGGRLLAEKGVLPTVVNTSLQTRAIRTAELALRELGRSWLPVRRHWRLNERHYGDLQGRDKAETAAKYGDEQFMIWRRSYDTPPPPLSPDDERWSGRDPRYAGLAPNLVPASECLADVVERMLPYWYDAIVPDLVAGHVVLVSAHGNSLRALVKHLDSMSDEAIVELNIPTGQPFVYELGPDFLPLEAKPLTERYLADADQIAAAAAAVAAQGKH